MSNDSHNKTASDNRAAVILHNFSNTEIAKILKAVKAQFDTDRDIIFAKSTPTSLRMQLSKLIEDLTEDHTYLKQNPPPVSSKQ